MTNELQLQIEEIIFKLKKKNSVQINFKFLAKTKTFQENVLYELERESQNKTIP